MNIRVVRFIGVLSAVSAASMVSATPAFAQLGRIVRTAKDAASINKDMKQASAATAANDFTITAERLSAVLKALSPMVAKAEKVAEIRAARADHDAKVKAADSCYQREMKSMTPASMANVSPANLEKVSQMSMRLGEIGQRMATLQQAKRYREYIASEDTMRVYSVLSQTVMYGLEKKCVIPYKSGVVLDADAEDMSDKSRSGSGGGTLKVASEDRGGMTHQQFGLVRERIAMWSLQQTGNAPPGNGGKQGIFTDAEHAVLKGREIDVKKLAPYFKTGTLAWAGWGDISEW